MDVGDHVVTVDLDHGADRRPQRGVQHGAVLGGVDAVPPQHGVDPPGHPGSLGQGQERGQDVVGHPVLGRVDDQIPHRPGEPLGPVGIVGEQRAQVEGVEAVGPTAHRIPLRSRRDVHGS